jgi:hypothetical protein
MLQRVRYILDKKHFRAHCAKLVFLHSVGPAGHIVHSGASEAQNVDIQFFMLGWDRYGFPKNCNGTCYVELLFLHPVGSARHIVHSGASGARNVDALFFMLAWDQYGFDKKCHRTRCAKLVFFCVRRDLRVT